ncbi:MAG: hypothetical protein BJG00_016200 [Limnothrix sp. CACIAM 69d]|nr:MAG: hypothetical protein BJG00_016200 [Limnothrix sp. CACIAM 69d]
MEYRVLPTTVVCADRDRAEQVVQWLAQVDTHWAQAASIVDGRSPSSNGWRMTVPCGQRGCWWWMGRW